MTNATIAKVAARAILTASAFIQAENARGTRSGYAPVNGLKMYYEVHGEGPPLILIHGTLGSTGTFADIIPELSKDRKVIAVDLQGHGRTADIDRPMSFQAFADDTAALMRYLGIQKADLMGYSMGGIVALRTATQHPELVERLVIVSSTFSRDGWYPEIITGMSSLSAATGAQLKQTPMYENYVEVAPRPEDWPVLCAKLGVLGRQDYDWSSEVAKIKMPVLLIFGDADAVRTMHAVEYFELLGGGKRDGGFDGSGMSSARLAILPGVTHYSIFQSPLFVPIVTHFLDVSLQTRQR
jgi:pimeloyl-ACP methyl ester carboxylesterase